MEILFADEYLFAIDKPAGHFVHPPERSRYPVPPEKICLYTLRERFERDVFPIHRLDAPTSGVVLFAFDKEITRFLSAQFAERRVEKVYHAVVRGFVDQTGEIDIPLEIAGFSEPNPSLTRYACLAQREFNVPVGKKYPTARYSLVEVRPETGRWHQIRRHFDRISHPLLGDIEHGDSHHNRFFRDQLKISGLCLRAKSLAFEHPITSARVEVAAQPNEAWRQVYDIFGDGA